MVVVEEVRLQQNIRATDDLSQLLEPLAGRGQVVAEVVADVAAATGESGDVQRDRIARLGVGEDVDRDAPQRVGVGGVGTAGGRQGDTRPGAGQLHGLEQDAPRPGAADLEHGRLGAAAGGDVAAGGDRTSLGDVVGAGTGAPAD